MKSKKWKKVFNEIFFLVISIFIILLITSRTTYAASKVVLKYDLDNNSKIEEADAKKILRHIVSKKTNKNDNWLVNEEDVDLRSFLSVLRYIEANNEKNIKEKHKDWLSLREEIVLNVKSREENLNLTTNNEVKIEIEGKNYGSPKFNSQNTLIAEVNQLGVITAKGKGNTIITVYDEKQLINETIRVNVSDDRETLKISKNNLILDISDNNMEKLEVEGKDLGTLTWSSSNDKIAIVDQEGNVIGKSNGECIIKATSSKGNKVECRVVVQTSPTKIELEKEEISLIVKENKEYKIKGRITPQTANVNKEVTYKSLDTTIATVDQEGLITAVSEGTTSIEVCTKNGKKATCRVKVMEEEKIPTISIKKQYEGDILTAGKEASYEITIEADTISSIDEKKIIGKGTLVTEAKYKITGNDNKYNLVLKVPDNEGTIGIVIEEGFVTNSSGKTNSKVEFEEQKVFKLETTATSDAITAAVGVINSFYIKDYDFYLDSEKKIENRTTNEYTYSNLKEGKTYKVKVHVNAYKNKETDDLIEGWLEKEVKTEKNSGSEMHFLGTSKQIDNLPDGSSDCIFIKTASGKTIMIDTAAETDNNGHRNAVPEIDKYLRVEKNGKDGNALVKAENGIVNVDYLIITHPDRDHLGGFQDLTGILYKQTSPGYIIDENNTINDEKIRYNFEKIILGCNTEKFDPDLKIAEIEDGAKGNDTVARAIEKAIYCYAKDSNKLKLVNSGNIIKIDDTILNIYNPYPYEDIPIEFLAEARSDYKTGINNNNSVVVKLLCGSRKTLLMGDAEFAIEEILLGIPSEQVKNNDSSIENGLRIDEAVNKVKYFSLVNDLLSNNYSGCSTVEELETKYKISRLTRKDLDAQILKKGHHGCYNTTSIPFLNNVKPSKIVVLGASSNNIYKESVIGCLNEGPDYCIREYYDSDYSGAESVEDLNFTGGKIKLTQNNWDYFVFNTDNLSTTDGNDKGKGSFCILTEDGMNWDYSDPYEKIKGTSATSQLSEFLKSWENVSMWKYLNGKTNNYNSDPYIYMCITEDKKEYLMCDDLFTGNNNRNFGFGICFYVGGYGFINQSFYAAEGINIEDSKYQTYGVSKLPVDVVDRVKERIIEYQRNNVRTMASNRGITLTDYQVDAVAACAYQGWQMGGFLDAYKQYGMDESIRYQSTGMGTSDSRYRANWKLFSTGVYTDPDGNEITIR